jgi:AraC-like DNA-binding protein
MFSGQEFPVHDVLPHAAILLSRVAGATNFEERITAFESFYIDYIKDELNINPLIQYATQRIIKSRGNLNIADLSNDCGYSTRYMVKIFEKYVGLSPKLFSRIMRFQYVVQALEVNEYPHILDHIYELGYCDQNHFIKDFKQFSRLTPKNYIHRLRS